MRARWGWVIAAAVGCTTPSTVYVYDAASGDSGASDVGASDASDVVDAGVVDASTGDVVDAGDVIDVQDAGAMDAADVHEAGASDAGDDVLDVTDTPDAGNVIDAPDVPDVPVVDAADVLDVPTVDVPDVSDVPDVGVDVGCGGGLTMCGGACVDTQTDDAHCGACGVGCTGGTCTAGACVCPMGRTLCAGRCVDLQTDIDHCGACNYRVVSAGRAGEAALRTCVAGRPNPPWVTMATLDGPTSAPGTSFGWTGRNYLVVEDGAVRLYEPNANVWTRIPLITPIPLGGQTGPTRCGLTFSQGVGLPDRNAFFFWGNGRSYLFIDDASPRWLPVGVSSVPGQRMGQSLAYDGSRVYMAFGASDCVNDGRAFPYSALSDVAALDLLTDRWSASMTSTAFCSMGRPLVSGAPFTVANRILFGFGGISDNTNYCHTSLMPRLDLDTFTWAGRYDTSITAATSDAALVSTGTAALLCSGASADSNLYGCYLIDPRSTPPTQTLNPPHYPTASAQLGRIERQTALFTGRSVILANGTNQTTGDHLAGGSIAIISGGRLVSWSLLPSGPSARAAAVFAPGQSQWTGREAIVFGGFNGTTPLLNGTRYQPPVGCVCPTNTDSPSWIPTPCAGVTNIAVTTCNP